MKNILIVYLINLFMFSAIAAYQFDKNIILQSNNGFEIYETYLTFDSSTNLSFNFDKRIDAFGYYNLTTDKIGFGKLNDDKKSGILGTFNVNDKIGLWVKQRHGFIYTSSITNKIPSIFVGSQYEIENDNNETNVEFIIGNRKGYEFDDGKWELDGIEFEIVGPYANKLNGQPLPGMTTTLLIVLLCCGGYFKYYKNNLN